MHKVEREDRDSLATTMVSWGCEASNIVPADVEFASLSFFVCCTCGEVIRPPMSGTVSSSEGDVSMESGRKQVVSLVVWGGDTGGAFHEEAVRNVFGLNVRKEGA